MTRHSAKAMTLDDLEIHKASRISGRVATLFGTRNEKDFVTHGQNALNLTFEGIPGDRHAGFTRKSGGREPWYPRGTEMCNERQVSLLSVEELELIASNMDIDEIRPEWIGGNIVTESIPHLSLLPSRTRLVFEGGAVVRVDGYNVPCRVAGKSVAEHYPEREGLDLLFPQRAKHRRGLVGYVEKPGLVHAGETITAHVPEQWIYAPGK
ncbi:MAG: MOSC domain-containing protein [Stappiaceae bacterium]